jgi:hypothetical protein
MSGMPLGTTEELARLVVRAIDKRKPRVIYPRAYTVARMFPSLTRWAVDKYGPLPKKLNP